MKSLFRRLVVAFVLTSSVQYYVSAQDQVIKCQHKYYTSWFSTAEHIPLVVNYTVTRSMVECAAPVKRKNKFTPDPEHVDVTNLMQDYRRSGYDRGHNMPAADNKCDMEGMTECFYFCNMTPQPHSFNAGIWEQLEKIERQEAEEDNTIIVTVGSVGKAGVIGGDKVVVPKYMWKVIYIPSLNQYQCYYFPDADDVNELLGTYEVALTKIEESANVTFTNGLPALKQH